MELSVVLFSMQSYQHLYTILTGLLEILDVGANLTYRDRDIFFYFIHVQGSTEVLKRKEEEK